VSGLSQRESSHADLLRTLGEKVAHRKLVPFVGAGVSLSVLKKDGTQAFPTWPQLLQHGALALRKNGKSAEADWVDYGLRVLQNPNAKGTDYIQLAGFINKNLPGGGWAAFLQKELDPNFDTIDDASLELPRQIWGLANQFVITTNFDRVLNWTSPRKENVRTLDLDDHAGLAAVLRDSIQNPTVFPLHGSIDNPGKIILTSEKYDQLYRTQTTDLEQYAAALLMLKSIFAAKSMLFIVFSFADQYIRQQLEWVASTFDGYSSEHFALVRRDERTRRRHCWRNCR
jgi:hypothetical protein